jgi:hypothetical protein
MSPILDHFYWTTPQEGAFTNGGDRSRVDTWQKLFLGDSSAVTHPRFCLSCERTLSEGRAKHGRRDPASDS